MTIGYLICLLSAIGLLIAYLSMVKARERWLTMLYCCVPVVDLGYLLLSLAKSLPLAILANDIAYFGSILLSMCMFLTVVRLCGFPVTRVHIVLSSALALLMLAIVATSGLLPWYYRSIGLETVDGATRLVKEYGPLHPLYLVYLLAYFAAMIVTILHSVRARVIGAPKFACLIAGVVCGNIVLWAFEKLVNWEYEFLSVTYLISELVLLLVFWMMQDYVHRRDLPALAHAEELRLRLDIAAMPTEERVERVLSLLGRGEALAPREREILGQILEGRRRREIAEQLCLSENTVKTYTRTLYAKLGIGNREELYALLLEK